MSLATKFSLQTIHTETIASHFLPHTTSQPFRPQNLNFINVHLRQTPYSTGHHQLFSLKSAFVSRDKGLLLRKCSTNGDSSPGEEEDDQALQAVLKLYNAIKNKNIRELSEIFGEECRCGCHFIPFFHSFRGKEQVMAFFSYLIKYLGNNIEFVFQPISKDGMTVGVTWKLEWNKAAVVPLGKGFSFHICQVYQGKAVIRNVEVFMEPLLHLEPFRLKVADFMVAAKEKISFLRTEERKLKGAVSFVLLTVLVLVAALLFFYKFPLD